VYSILEIKKSSSYVQNIIKLEEILTEQVQVKTEEQIVAFLKAKQGIFLILHLNNSQRPNQIRMFRICHSW
jgi:MoxR-like ATPase